MAPYLVLNSFDAVKYSAIWVSDQVLAGATLRLRPIQNFRPPASGARPRNARYRRTTRSTSCRFSSDFRNESSRSPLVLVPPVSFDTHVADSPAVGGRFTRSWNCRATSADQDANGAYGSTGTSD